MFISHFYGDEVQIYRLTGLLRSIIRSFTRRRAAFASVSAIFTLLSDCSFALTLRSSIFVSEAKILHYYLSNIMFLRCCARQKLTMGALKASSFKLNMTFHSIMLYQNKYPGPRFTCKLFTLDKVHSSICNLWMNLHRHFCSIIAWTLIWLWPNN